VSDTSSAYATAKAGIMASTNKVAREAGSPRLLWEGWVSRTTWPTESPS